MKKEHRLTHIIVTLLVVFLSTAFAQSFQGVAGAYGAQYAGNPTANGEVHNPQEPTAAHSSLAFGTWVRVTNLTTGASVDVRINDRIPQLPDRDIELSHIAAQAIGLNGLANVQIDLINSGARTEVSPFGALPSNPTASQIAVSVPAEGLSMQQVVARHYPTGTILTLQGNNQQIQVQVVANNIPNHINADFMVNPEVFAALGQNLTITN